LSEFARRNIALVKKLELAEPTYVQLEILMSHGDHGVQEVQSPVPANDCGSLQQAFGGGRQPVHARRHNGLNRAGHGDALERTGEMVGTRAASEVTGVNQGSDCLFQK
jgi:hypothetical protein